MFKIILFEKEKLIFFNFKLLKATSILLLESLILSDNLKSSYNLSTVFFPNLILLIPLIIIFDEGTSSLDQSTENKIIDELYKLKNKKTLIIISHNKNTIKNCDIIYDMDQKK